jgi:tRNA modification GTPase
VAAAREAIGEHAELFVDANGALERKQALRFAELFAAEDVRLAARALGAVTGRVDVEDILDRLFATFCIGK